MSDFVTTILPTFYPVVLLGGKNTTPTGVKVYTITATFTGTDSNVNHLLNILTLRQVVILLNQFTFKVSGTTYIVSASAPSPGTTASKGGTLDTIFGNLFLCDLGELLSQVTLKVNSATSYQIGGQPEANLPSEFVTFVQETIGQRSAGYLGVGLSLMQFTIKETAPTAGSPVSFTLTTNKNHSE